MVTLDMAALKVKISTQFSSLTIKQNSSIFFFFYFFYAERVGKGPLSAEPRHFCLSMTKKHLK